MFKKKGEIIMSVYYIGVDLGGTKLYTALADEDGKIISGKKMPTEADKGEEVIINNITASIDSVLKDSGVAKKDVEKIGIGSPGPLSVRKGIIYETANMSWENVPILKIMEEKTGLPVKLENDANAAALGEKWFGAGKGIDDLIYITVSTGIGGGIIINKRAYHGFDGAAGEVGHMIIEPDGPQCGCGNYGCLESLASGTAIARDGKDLLESNQPETMIREMSNNNPDQVDALLIARAAKKGDKIAKDLYLKAGWYLGIGLANLINLFNPEMIVLGGGIMRDKELMDDSMQKSLEDRAISTSLELVNICKVELGDEAGVKGAIAVAMEERLLS